MRQSNTGNTRIFSFGVGDDVNTVLLDALADSTKAVSTYVRETEDIEAKVSSLYGKISNPVLANLKLSLGEGVTLERSLPSAVARPLPRQSTGGFRPLQRQRPDLVEAYRHARQRDQGICL